jgi:lysine 2,3-aminomutase
MLKVAPKNGHGDIQKEYRQRAARENLLPIKITPFYQKKIDEEAAALGSEGGPLTRGIYPVEEKLGLRAPSEVPDWVDDRANMPSEARGIFIQKYRDRVLFTPTSTCAAHCLYCFRQDVLGEQRGTGGPPALEQQLVVLVDHLKKHPEIQEVIFSGGDPLTLSMAELEFAFTEIGKVKSVTQLRVHSRAPIFAPQTLKENKMELLARHKVRLYFHIIHPYEICAEIEKVIGDARKAGIRLYNHFPLLRKINDHADVLLRLMTKLDALGVINASVYVPEPIHYSAAYRISYDRMCRLIDEVIARSPSWINAFRFCLDSPYGKVRRENLLLREREKGLLVFQREGQKIIYPDFPEEMDAPGDIKTLLWKDYAPSVRDR